MITSITLDASTAIEVSAKLAKALAHSPHPLAEGFRLRIGYALLQNIAYHFEQRSGPAGPKPGFGPKSAGYAWEKLSPLTIERRRVSAQEKKKYTKETKDAAKKTKAFLKKQVPILKKQFMAKGIAAPEAAKRAEAQARNLARQKFGTSNYKERLRNREVMILRDTGRLLSSLMPGQIRAGGIDIPKEQILKSIPGSVTVGTNVKYARTHQHGDPARNIPARPLWPEKHKIPKDWWEDVNEQARLGLIYVLGNQQLSEMLASV